MKEKIRRGGGGGGGGGLDIRIEEVTHTYGGINFILMWT